jgi:hypothetical protein
VGYSSETYARSLTHMGQAIPLPESGTWVLARPIPGAIAQDACGPYPLWLAQDFTRLETDLQRLQPEWVSLVGVLSPFVQSDMSALFGDCYRPYKEHLCVDLRAPLRPSTHHRRNLRKADQVTTQEITHWEPVHLEAWQSLYAQLIARHQITGAAAFPPESLAAQRAIPGLRTWAATAQGQIVGMTLWITDSPYAYYHLGAFNELGYACGAAFALFATALKTLQQEGLQEVDLGAGAGTWQGSEGLTRFKRGWATHTRTAWLCGKILDPAQYAALSQNRATFFPAYRHP